MKFISGFILGWLTGVLMLVSTIAAFFVGHLMSEKEKEDKIHEKFSKPSEEPSAV